MERQAAVHIRSGAASHAAIPSVETAMHRNLGGHGSRRRAGDNGEHPLAAAVANDHYSLILITS